MIRANVISSTTNDQLSYILEQMPALCFLKKPEKAINGMQHRPSTFRVCLAQARKEHKRNCVSLTATVEGM